MSFLSKLLSIFSMGSIPAQYQNLPGYNTIYGDEELRSAIALKDILNTITLSTFSAGSSANGSTGSSNKSINRAVDFAYNSTYPMLIKATTGSSRLLKIIIGINTAFNGTGLSLSLGDANNSQGVVKVGTIPLNQVETFELSPGLFYSQPTQIFLYLSVGSTTTGSGFIYLLEG